MSVFNIPPYRSFPELLVADYEWLDGHSLSAKVYPKAEGEYPCPAVFNAITGEVINLGFADLANRDLTDVAIPSPNLEFIVYVELYEKREIRLTLWSLADRETVWAYQNYEDSLIFSKGPGDWQFLAWSPDSKSFAFTSPENPDRLIRDQKGIYVFDIDLMDEISVTNFADEVDEFWSTILGWSPNGDYLAIEVSRWDEIESARRDILIYESSTWELVYSCAIPAALHNLDFIWSPSSDSYIVTYYSETGDDFSPAIYSDIVFGATFTIAEADELRFVGSKWSLNFQPE